MKGKRLKKGISLCMIVTILSLQCPVNGSVSVQAAGNRKEINLGTSVLSTGGYTGGYWTEVEGIKVYLGQATQGDDTSNVLPMPYRVLNSDGTTQAFLDGDTVISHQHMTSNGTTWSESPAGRWLENTFYGGSSNFSPLEKSLIVSTNLAEETYSQTVQSGEYSLKDEATTLHVFSISAKEAVTYYHTDAVRDKSGAHHWLRTAVTTENKRVSVYTGGALDAYAADNEWVRMCPAMNINLNNVAFTKAYSYTNGNFSTVSDMTDNEWTLAIQDGNTNFSATETSRTPFSELYGGTIELELQDSSSGYTYTQISGMLVNAETKEVLYYGKIANADATSVSVEIPSGLSADDYLLYIFKEQTGTGTSSYVSNMVSIEVTVEKLYDFSVNQESNLPGYTIEGETVQEYVAEIEDVIVTAGEGYYFPKNYVEQIYYRTRDMEVPEQATDLKEYGITVTRISGSKIHIAGTLTESLHLFLPDASKKEIVELSFAPYELSYEMGTSVQIFKAITAMKNADTEVVVPSNAVRYASSDTTVADVDSITGEITLKKAGTFRITATLAEGEDYLGTSIESEIITVMPEVIPPVFVMPETQYERKAELGKNSYYISPLTLVAPEGYYISTDSTKGFGESVTFLTSSNQAVVYLKDVTSGLISEAIQIPAFKIDSSAPVIPEIKNESTIYGSSIVLNVMDENLVKLVINGEEQELTGGITKIELSANYGIEKYEILAIDEAGNETTLTFTLAEEWMKSGMIPASRIVYLRTGQPYRLGGGTWTVGGDSTEYNGGITFYIRSEEQYIFQSR